MRFFLLSTPFFAITKIKKYTFFINLQKTIKISLKILKGSTDLPFTGVCVGTMKQFKAVYFTFAILGFSLLLFPTIKGSYATTEQNHLGTAIQEVNTQNKEKVDSAVKKIDKQRRFMLLGAIANGAMGAYFLNKQCNPRSDPVEAPDETKKKEFAEARDKAQGGRESAVAEAQTQPAAEAQTQPVAEAQSQPVAEAQSQATASGTGPDGSITKTPADQPSGFAANQPTPTPAGTAQGGGLSGAIDTTGPGSWGTTPPAGTAQGGGLSGAIDTTGPGSWGTTPPAGTAQGGGLSGAIDTTGPGSWGTTPPAGTAQGGGLSGAIDTTGPGSWGTTPPAGTAQGGGLSGAIDTTGPGSWGTTPPAGTAQGGGLSGAIDTTGPGSWGTTPPAGTAQGGGLSGAIDTTGPGSWGTTPKPVAKPVPKIKPALSTPGGADSFKWWNKHTPSVRTPPAMP